MVLALSLPVSITDLVTASLLTVSLRFFSFSLLGFGGGGRITGRSHPAAWLVPNTWLLFPPLSFSLSSSLPVSSNQESLLLSPPGKSCLPPSFLVSCFLLYAVLLKNSFSLNKFRKIAPSHYRWAGHPPHYSHPHLGLSTRPPKREELFWAKERGSKT